MRRAILGFILIGSVVGTVCAQDARKFTLREAVEFAWANQPSVKIAEEEVRTAEAQVGGAKAGRLPQISAMSAFTYNGKLPKTVIDFGENNPFAGGDNQNGEPTDEPPAEEGPPADSGPIEFELGTRIDFRALARVDQPLFTWGKIGNNIRQTESNLRAVRHKAETAKQGVTLSVTEAFYGVLTSQEYQRLAQEGLAQATHRLQIAQERFEAGIATKLDVLQAQVALGNARTQATRAQHGQALARQGFALALGLDPNTPVEPQGELDSTPTEFDVEALLQAARASRPDIKELEAREEGMAHLVKIAKAGNKPSLAANAQYGFADTERQELQSTWSVGLGLNIPIFDGYATRAQSRQAESAQRTVSLGKDALLDGVSMQVRQAYLSYMEAKQVLETQRETTAQADEVLRIANLSFENGVITSLELADAELGRTAAHANTVQAMHDLAVAQARLEKAVGAPLR